MSSTTPNWVIWTCSTNSPTSAKPSTTGVRCRPPARLRAESSTAGVPRCCWHCGPAMADRPNVEGLLASSNPYHGQILDYITELESRLRAAAGRCGVQVYGEQERPMCGEAPQSRK